jgi:hypothetical protein
VFGNAGFPIVGQIGWLEASDDAVNNAVEDQRLAVVGQILVVLAQASMPSEPTAK